MAARTLAFALGALFTHQLLELPDALYLGLAPLLLPLALQGNRQCSGAIGACFLIGCAWSAVHGQMALDRRLPAQAQGSNVVIDGRIIRVDRTDHKRARFTLEIDDLTAPPSAIGSLHLWSWAGCRIRVSWYRPDENAWPRAGERWRVALRLRQVRGLRNDGGFDREHRALRERLCASGYVRADSLPLALAGTQWSLNRLREDIAQGMRTHLSEAQISGILVALAVGIRDWISVDQRSAMQRTGTAHLMAISGLHIGLVAALGLLLGRCAARAVPRAMLIMPANHWGAVLALTLALIYAALAGFSIPTQRALLMLGTFLCAALLGRNIARHHGLAMALLVVLIADPLAVNDAGTWLSFVAVAGLMWALGPLAARAHDEFAPRHGILSVGWARGINHLRLALRVQLAASVVILPLALAWFEYQSLLSPFANLIAIPITGLLVVPLTLAAVLVEPMSSFAAGGLLHAAAYLLQWVFSALQWLADADLLFTPARTPSLTALLCAFVGIAVLLSPLSKRLRLTGLLWLAPLLFPPSSRPPGNGLDLHVLDVGQGLSVLLRTHSHALLFDAGPSWSNGNNAGTSIVVPALRRQGLVDLDVLLISHHHQDHAGGLPGVLRTMSVNRLLGEHGHARISTDPCRAGQHWRWDDYEFRILHPAILDSHSASDVRVGNDTSCVLRVSGPGGSVLLPADIETRAESTLLRSDAKTLRSDVLFVPHHGSRTSSTVAFLQAVQPRLAINSSGHRNRFSLPSQEVVQRYRAFKIPFMDTACVGAIHIRLRARQAPRVSHWQQDRPRFWHSRDRALHCDSAIDARVGSIAAAKATETR